jgi:hypothetical protein
MAKFDDYGVQRGLAYQHDWNAATNRMLQFEQYKQQNQVKREQKAQYFADKIQRGKASTKYNTQRLQKYYDQLNEELGTFLVENPDWEQDIMKVNEFNSITDKYINNPIMAEDLQVKKELELVRQDRGNMDYEHFETLMKTYEDYDNQEIGDDPLAESQVKFRYLPEAQLDVLATLGRYSNLVGMESRQYEENGKIISRTKPDEDKVNTAWIMMQDDKKAMRSFNHAFENYLAKGGKDYSELKDFVKAGLRSTKNIQEAISTLRGRNSGSGGGEDFPPNVYSIDVLEGLVRSANESEDGIGRYDIGEEGILLTDYGKIGALVNPNDDSVSFAARTDDNGNVIPAIKMSKYEFRRQLKAMRVVNAGEMRYSPENNGYVIDINVVIDKPSLSSDEKDKKNNIVTDLEKRGFVEIDNYYSFFGEKLGDMTSAPKKRGMYGKITVPADPTNPNRYNKYEQEMGGKSLDWQKTVDQEEDYIISSYKNYAEQAQNRWDVNQEEVEKRNSMNEANANPLSQIDKNTATKEGDLDLL